MARAKSGIRERLSAHRRSKHKGPQWDHFSVYAVWPNVSDEEIIVLEGLIRAMFRRDSRVNSLATAKSFGILKRRALG
jgi:hypothetical protein